MFETLIATDQLAERLADPHLAVIDCRFSLADTARGRREYLQAHIPGAVYAHLDEDLSGPVIPGKTSRHPLPDPDEFARKLGAWGIGPDTQVVVYDDSHGGVAARLWWMLRWLGHDAVALLDGGWPAWRQESRPHHSGQETRPPQVFTPRLRPELLVSATEVERLLNDPSHRLIDARAGERFRGEEEPLDPVAGHIPGALNAPWAANVDSDGRMLPAATLAARYRLLIGDTPPERVICYCGSGVTANHDILAMLYAGLGEARLYAGSWSEWITDPSRPLATGE